MTTAGEKGRVIVGRPREECGVVAVSGSREAAKLTYLSLFALQHRGQETAGIVSAPRGGDVAQHIVHRGLGLVPDVFDAATLDRLVGDVAIGHVRYSTTGTPNPQNTQPICSSLRFGPVAVGHNGNLTNASTVRAQLKAEGAIFQTSIDTEVILHLISRSRAEDFESCLREALQQIEGAYSLVILHGNRLYAVRDPHGFRPLSLARTQDDGWIVASETVAFDLVGAEFVRDIEPGEIIVIDPGCGPVSLAPLPPKPHARCIFELIYFARPDSVIDGRSVQRVREALGAELWREHPAVADVVIAIPASSVTAAIGYARAGGLPFEMGLMRNQYIGRTFIEPFQRIRDFGAKVKYNPVRSSIEGRRVVVIDDSIVRGTTMKKITRMLRHAGATEVHLRIASPPWRHSCMYGIDTPDRSEFVATNRRVEAICEVLEADSLGYLSTDGLTRAAREGTGWCMACFTGNYPTEKRQLSKEALEDGPVQGVEARGGQTIVARGSAL